MALKDTLLPEYDHEMGTTRKLLERVPDPDFPWKPHEKSMTLGRLASHLAEIPHWVGAILDASSFDLAAAGDGPPPPLESRSEVLAAFDRHVAATREAIAARSDAELMAPWTLKRGGHEMFTLPKVAVLRSFLLNHSIHHRGQLSVYLRLRDVPLPSIYGPSADEPGF
jgi:uncharacterized damage-inducible protein DinB